MSAIPRKEIDQSTYAGRFSARLKYLREKRNLSVEKLAKLSGIPDKTLYRWEASTQMPPVDKLPYLASALRVKPRTLLPE